jgi:hypothetical protein
MAETKTDAPEGFKTFELKYGDGRTQTRYRCKTCRNDWDTYDKDAAVAHLGSAEHTLWSTPKGA